MKEPHNHAHVGYGMILVAASLAVIALVALAIGSNVLFGDNIQRANQAHFKECKANDFKTQDCEKYLDRLNNDVAKIYVDLEK
jgi:hypothetical protein